MKLDEFEMIEEQVQDIRFGHINIYTSNIDAESVIMEKFKKCASIEDFAFNCVQIEQRMKIAHKNILKMLYAKQNEDAYSISSFFEYPNEDLCQRRKFLIDPREIIKFLDNMLDAMTYLQRHRMVHGDIRPEYIYFNSSLNEYVLIDRLIDSSSVPNLQSKNIQLRDKTLYNSPMLFDQVSRGNLNPRHNPFKSEVFSLGMVLVSMFIHEEDIMNCYDFERLKFDEVYFYHLTEKVKNDFFSDPIGDIIGEFIFGLLMNPNESERLSPKSALKFLRRGLIDQLIESLEDMTDSKIHEKEIHEFLNNYQNENKNLQSESIEGLSQSIQSNGLNPNLIIQNLTEKEKNEKKNNQSENQFIDSEKKISFNNSNVSQKSKKISIYQSNRELSESRKSNQMANFNVYDKVENQNSQLENEEKEYCSFRKPDNSEINSKTKNFSLEETEKISKISGNNLKMVFEQVKQNLSMNDLNNEAVSNKNLSTSLLNNTNLETEEAFNNVEMKLNSNNDNGYEIQNQNKIDNVQDNTDQNIQLNFEESQDQELKYDDENLNQNIKKNIEEKQNKEIEEKVKNNQDQNNIDNVEETKDIKDDIENNNYQYLKENNENEQNLKNNIKNNQNSNISEDVEEKQNHELSENIQSTIKNITENIEYDETKKFKVNVNESKNKELSENDDQIQDPKQIKDFEENQNSELIENIEKNKDQDFMKNAGENQELIQNIEDNKNLELIQKIEDNQNQELIQKIEDNQNQEQIGNNKENQDQEQILKTHKNLDKEIKFQEPNDNQILVQNNIEKNQSQNILTNDEEKKDQNLKNLERKQDQEQNLNFQNGQNNNQIGNFEVNQNPQNNQNQEKITNFENNKEPGNFEKNQDQILNNQNELLMTNNQKTQNQDENKNKNFDEKKQEQNLNYNQDLQLNVPKSKIPDNSMEVDGEVINYSINEIMSNDNSSSIPREILKDLSAENIKLKNQEFSENEDKNSDFEEEDQKTDFEKSLIEAKNKEIEELENSAKYNLKILVGTSLGNLSSNPGSKKNINVFKAESIHQNEEMSDNNLESRNLSEKAEKKSENTESQNKSESQINIENYNIAISFKDKNIQEENQQFENSINKNEIEIDLDDKSENEINNSQKRKSDNLIEIFDGEINERIKLKEDLESLNTDNFNQNTEKMNPITEMTEDSNTFRESKITILNEKMRKKSNFGKSEDIYETPKNTNIVNVENKIENLINDQNLFKKNEKSSSDNLKKTISKSDIISPNNNQTSPDNQDQWNSKSSNNNEMKIGFEIEGNLKNSEEVSYPSETLQKEILDSKIDELKEHYRTNPDLDNIVLEENSQINPESKKEEENAFQSIDESLNTEQRKIKSSIINNIIENDSFENNLQSLNNNEVILENDGSENPNYKTEQTVDKNVHKHNISVQTENSNFVSEQKEVQTDLKTVQSNFQTTIPKKDKNSDLNIDNQQNYFAQSLKNEDEPKSKNETKDEKKEINENIKKINQNSENQKDVVDNKNTNKISETKNFEKKNQIIIEITSDNLNNNQKESKILNNQQTKFQNNEISISEINSKSQTIPNKESVISIEPSFERTNFITMESSFDTKDAINFKSTELEYIQDFDNQSAKTDPNFHRTNKPKISTKFQNYNFKKHSVETPNTVETPIKTQEYIYVEPSPQSSNQRKIYSPSFSNNQNNFEKTIPKIYSDINFGNKKPISNSTYIKIQQKNPIQTSSYLGGESQGVIFVNAFTKDNTRNEKIVEYQQVPEEKQTKFNQLLKYDSNASKNKKFFKGNHSSYSIKIDKKLSDSSIIKNPIHKSSFYEMNKIRDKEYKLTYIKSHSNLLKKTNPEVKYSEKVQNLTISPKYSQNGNLSLSNSMLINKNKQPIDIINDNLENYGQNSKQRMKKFLKGSETPKEINGSSNRIMSRRDSENERIPRIEQILKKKRNMQKSNFPNSYNELDKKNFVPNFRKYNLKNTGSLDMDNNDLRRSNSPYYYKFDTSRSPDTLYQRLTQKPKNVDLARYKKKSPLFHKVEKFPKKKNYKDKINEYNSKYKISQDVKEKIYNPYDSYKNTINKNSQITSKKNIPKNYLQQKLYGNK